MDFLEAARLAWAHGADRVELCQALELGGLTPSEALIQAVVEVAPGAVFAMIRPRPGSFVVDRADRAVMAAEARMARRAGAAGLVVGGITASGGIDRDLVSAVVEQGGGLPITFHRAFDALSVPLAEAMDQLHQLGVARVLTSGGAATAHGGRETLARLVACGRPAVLAGGGIRSDTALELVRASGVKEIHLAGVRFVGPADGFGRRTEPDIDRVASVMSALERALGPRAT